MFFIKFFPIIAVIAKAVEGADMPVNVPESNAGFHFNVNPSNSVNYSSVYLMNTKTYSKTKSFEGSIKNTTEPTIVPVSESDNLEVEFWLAFIGITGTFLILA